MMIDLTAFQPFRPDVSAATCTVVRLREVTLYALELR